MTIFDLLWWFFDLDKHSSQIKGTSAQQPPEQQPVPEPEAEFDAWGEEPEKFADGDPDDEFFE